MDSSFVPQVLLIGAICGGIAAVGFGALSDRMGRRPVYSFIMLASVLLPGPAFVALNTGNPVAPDDQLLVNTPPDFCVRDDLVVLVNRFPHAHHREIDAGDLQLRCGPCQRSTVLPQCPGRC